MMNIHIYISIVGKYILMKIKFNVKKQLIYNNDVSEHYNSVK